MTGCCRPEDISGLDLSYLQSSAHLYFSSLNLFMAADDIMTQKGIFSPLALSLIYALQLHNSDNAFNLPNF